MPAIGRWHAKADLYACLGKTRWTTERAAKWALQNLRQQGAALDRQVRPYRCRATGASAHWHLGHSE